MEVTCHPRPGGGSAPQVRAGGHRNHSDGCCSVGLTYFSKIRTVMPCWPRESFVPVRFTVTLPIELLSTNL